MVISLQNIILTPNLISRVFAAFLKAHYDDFICTSYSTVGHLPQSENKISNTHRVGVRWLQAWNLQKRYKGMEKEEQPCFASDIKVYPNMNFEHFFPVIDFYPVQ